MSTHKWFWALFLVLGMAWSGGVSAQTNGAATAKPAPSQKPAAQADRRSTTAAAPKKKAEQAAKKPSSANAKRVKAAAAVGAAGAVAAVAARPSIGQTYGLHQTP
ncbi:MAG: hypothetical protein ACKPCJ_11120, partial [Betaproteobacteria bacterium]